VTEKASLKRLKLTLLSTTPKNRAYK